jgi:hypothetical protein
VGATGLPPRIEDRPLMASSLPDADAPAAATAPLRPESPHPRQTPSSPRGLCSVETPRTSLIRFIMAQSSLPGWLNACRTRDSKGLGLFLHENTGLRALRLTFLP